MLRAVLIHKHFPPLDRLAGVSDTTLSQGQAMSEAEQNETPQRTEDEWLELEAELTEVRKKRDQLDAQNLRVTDNLRKAIEERDKALANAESWRVEYLAAKESANTNSDNAAALREQVAEMDVDLRQMRVELDAAELERTKSRAEVVQLRAERDAVKEVNGSANRMIEALQGDVRHWQAQRDAARKFADDTQVQLSQWQVGHDAIKEELARCKEGTDMLEQENKYLQDTVRELRAKQIHGDLPGLLMSIQLAAEQARLLI